MIKAKTLHRTVSTCLLLSIGLFGEPPNVLAQTAGVLSSQATRQQSIEFDLPQQSLAKTLVELGVQADIAIIVPFELVDGHMSSPLIGRYSLERALDKVLWRAPLTFRIEFSANAQTIVIHKKVPVLASPSRPKLVQSDSLEELVVTGIRASLTQSVSVKRLADGIVDTISAEDIGKFPDTNLAESLQRISGVSISRANGEGALVTVRGFGESYNLVTLNGRSMPTALAPANGVGNTRAYDFSNIASEGVSAVEVHKTSQAALTTGGIGATIDVKTVRPMDSVGFNSFLGVKAVKDTTNRSGRQLTPELSGLLSWTDNKLWGLSVFGSLQERDSGSSGAFVDEWNTSPWIPLGEEGALPAHDAACEQTGGNPFEDQCYQVVNSPQRGELYSIPSQLYYTATDTVRKRTNAHITLQYKPVESVAATFDYRFSEKTTKGSRAEQSVRFTANRSYLHFDDELVKTPVISSETIFDSSGQPSGKGLRFGQQAFDTVSKNHSIGMNLAIDVTDNFKLIVDAHDSSARSGPGGAEYGSWANVSVGANVIGAQTIDWQRDLPIMGITINDILLSPNSNNGILDAGDIGTQVAFSYYSLQESDITQVRLDGLIELDQGEWDFGFELRDMQSHSRYSDTYFTMGDWGITDPHLVPDSYFTPRDFSAEFPDYYTTGVFGGGFDANAPAITAWAVDQYDGVFVDGFRYSENWGVDRTVKEVTMAAYSQFSADFDVAGISASFVAGMRYEATNVDSITNVVVPSEIVWLDNNDFETLYGPDREVFTVKNHYSNLLPSIDIVLDATDQLKARFAYSKTISRAPYNQLSSTVSGFDVLGVTSPGQVSAITLAGNPKLKPLESDNIDLSFEYYANDLSYISMGGYWKRINNFIGIKPELLPHFDLRDSSIGPRAKRAAELLESDPNFDGTISPTDLFNQIAATEHQDPNEGGEDSYYGDEYDIHPEPDDPPYQVTTYTPVNNKAATISGLEFAVQHFFGESGFGFLLNYTTVNGDVDYDVSAEPNSAQFALIGLSDTMNVVGMYEKYGFQLRLAHNWRAEYLSYLSDEPRYTEAYSQFDVMLSYNINEHFSISCEGLNVTESNSRQHARSHVQLWQLEQLGARYMLGARLLF